MGADGTQSAVRIDKWLWAVRVFKTRSQAASACQNSRIRISGEPVKPSRVVKIGDVYTVSSPGLTLTVKVLRSISQRVGASLVAGAMEDLTPPQERERAREAKVLDGYCPRPRGLGRPTKRDRRAIDEALS
ncbi:MAG: RNA-binding S4 domain-containing protein [Verrucomicrobia bacterium]|nr:RNA-binding S4 domain-containing protein [Verrucomicrobiota bacterium]